MRGETLLVVVLLVKTYYHPNVPLLEVRDVVLWCQSHICVRDGVLAAVRSCKGTELAIPDPTQVPVLNLFVVPAVQMRRRRHTRVDYDRVAGGSSCRA